MVKLYVSQFFSAKCLTQKRQCFGISEVNLYITEAEVLFAAQGILEMQSAYLRTSKQKAGKFRRNWTNMKTNTGFSYIVEAGVLFATQGIVELQSTYLGTRKRKIGKFRRNWINMQTNTGFLNS